MALFDKMNLGHSLWWRASRSGHTGTISFQVLNVSEGTGTANIAHKVANSGFGLKLATGIEGWTVFRAAGSAVLENFILSAFL